MLAGRFGKGEGAAFGDVMKLLNCPFCGEAPSMKSRPEDANSTQFFSAVACFCGGYSACAHQMATANTRAEAEAAALAAWNRRVAQPVAQACKSAQPNSALGRPDHFCPEQMCGWLGGCRHAAPPTLPPEGAP